MERAIRNIPYIPGSTNTADALLVMREDIFNVATGDRDDIPNVAIVITDGISNLNSHRTLPEAHKSWDQGIHIFTIGIGLTGETEELDGMATPPASLNRFLVENFEDLAVIRPQVYTKMCECKQ